MSTPSPFPFVSTTGTPYERGRAYGAAVPGRIRRSVEIYGAALDGLAIPAPAKQSLIDEFVGRIDAFGAHYLEEMRGIADGASIPLGDVVMINARTEIIAKARRIAAGDDEIDLQCMAADEGCTGAVVLPARSASGKVLHAQNWDWRWECIDTAIVLRVVQDDGPDILTFTEAGGLARSGLNSAGVAITANYLECERDFRSTGVPLALLRRKVLEQSHFAEAIRAVVKTPKTCANNVMLSSAEGFAIDFECAPDETFAILPEDEMIVHANHWTSPVALSKLRDTGVFNMPESYYRDWRVKRILEQSGSPISLDDLKEAFFDKFGTPYSVCRPSRPNSAGDLSATVAMIAMEPEAGVMDVAPMPAAQRTFTRYTLSEDPVTL